MFNNNSSQCWVWGAKFQHLGIKVLSFNLTRPSLFLKSTLEILKEIRTQKFEIVQGWMYHGNLVALILKCFIDDSPRLFWSIRQTLYDVNNEKLMTKIVIGLNRFFSSRPNAIIYNILSRNVSTNNMAFRIKTRTLSQMDLTQQI